MEIHSPIAPINPAKLQIKSRRPGEHDTEERSGNEAEGGKRKGNAMRRKMGDWSRLKARHKRRNQYRWAHKNATRRGRAIRRLMGCLDGAFQKHERLF